MTTKVAFLEYLPWLPWLTECHFYLYCVANIEIRLECRCLQKCFLIWNYVGCLWAPTLGFDTKQRNSFLIKFGVFYYKNMISPISMVSKGSHGNDEQGENIIKIFILCLWLQTVKTQPGWPENWDQMRPIFKKVAKISTTNLLKL
jgi:hypothetical protein